MVRSYVEDAEQGQRSTDTGHYGQFTFGDGL